MNTIFHPQLPILTLLYLFFILNHSILSFSAGNSPIPNSPYDDNIPNNDYSNSILSAPKQSKFAFGRVNTVATVVTILLTLLNIIVYKLRKLQESNFYEQLNVPLEHNCRRFFIDDILLATNHFDDDLVIGHGGFGKVYKGVIDKGTLAVAIKRLNRTSHQGAREFWTEVEMLSKFRHSHLVSLIGYCNNCNEMILVYEYMSHGTVADHLYKVGRNGNNSSLSWVQRLKICIGAARGLDYLHTGTGIQHRVIHRDVKSSNILLDENWAAKISDFGLSITGPADQSCTHVSTHVKGTFGYMDPEYFLTRRLTRKSDVYAFGVVLFEVLSGRRAIDVRLEEEQWGLAGWAQQCFKEGNIQRIIDPSLKWEIFPNSLNSFAQIGNQCLDYHPKKRPTMAEVVAALESALAFQQKRDSSMTEMEMEIFDICGTSENQENAEQQEVIGAGNCTHEQEKPARIMGFKRMVRQFFRGTAQVSSGEFQVTSGMSTRFSYKDLKIATENFSKKLGEGGFGSVFEGTLKDGTKVAVKCLEGLTQVKKSFVAEVETIGSIHHVNLVGLIGFCAEKSHRWILVYEYMCNGSLDRWIYHKSEEGINLDWKCRKKIILDIAKGLSYLHEDCRQRIIHMDIKPQNILLDQNYNAKVADFGLSKLVDRNQSQVMTTMRGTPGYLAPEWLSSIITEKVDVYSFGVVVLEICCGRKNCDRSQSEESMHLLSLFQKRSEEGKLLDMVDSYSEDMQSNGVEVLEMMKMAAWCLQNEFANRPSMSMVVKVIEGVMEVEQNLDCIFSNPLPKADVFSTSRTSLSPSFLSGPR